MQIPLKVHEYDGPNNKKYIFAKLMMHVLCWDPNIRNVISFIVDTGAAKTCICEADSKILKIPTHKLKKVKKEDRPVSLIGPIPAYSLSNVKLSCTAKKMNCTFAMDDIFVLENTSEADSILGVDFLNKFKLTLVYSPYKNKGHLVGKNEVLL